MEYLSLSGGKLGSACRYELLVDYLTLLIFLLKTSLVTKALPPSFLDFI